MLARLAVAALLTLGFWNGARAELAKMPSSAIDPNEPVFDEGTAERINETITLYKDIAARGGWPLIPSDARFNIGTANPHDALLRRVSLQAAIWRWTKRAAATTRRCRQR